MPYILPDSTANLPVFIFGESYGGAYAVSLARKLQENSKAGKYIYYSRISYSLFFKLKVKFLISLVAIQNQVKIIFVGFQTLFIFSQK